jgi:hypothetical protein
MFKIVTMQSVTNTFMKKWGTVVTVEQRIARKNVTLDRKSNSSPNCSSGKIVTILQ